MNRYDIAKHFHWNVMLHGWPMTIESLPVGNKKLLHVIITTRKSTS